MGQQGRDLMSQREAQRLWLSVLQGVKGKALSQAQAAQQLDLSVRQVKRKRPANHILASLPVVC